jgi:hypothetical protein
MNKFYSRMLTLICVLLCCSGFMSPVLSQTNLKGSWILRDGVTTYTLVIIDQYASVSAFEPGTKKFLYTTGGTCMQEGNKLSGKIEFDSRDKTAVGSAYAWTLEHTTEGLILNRNGKTEKWVQTDDGKGPLAGNWRITAREQNGQMVPMNPGARKTIKLLSGKRFQWAAINTDTGEFFGTGGGEYSFNGGKYTEHIEYFSRDSSRVGLSLHFDGKVEGKNWHHSGKSSKGDPINEIWSKQ